MAPSNGEIDSPDNIPGFEHEGVSYVDVPDHIVQPPSAEDLHKRFLGEAERRRAEALDARKSIDRALGAHGPSMDGLSYSGPKPPEEDGPEPLGPQVLAPQPGTARDVHAPVMDGPSYTGDTPPSEPTGYQVSEPLPESPTDQPPKAPLWKRVRDGFKAYYKREQPEQPAAEAAETASNEHAGEGHEHGAGLTRDARIIQGLINSNKEGATPGLYHLKIEAMQQALDELQDANVIGNMPVMVDQSRSGSTVRGLKGRVEKFDLYPTDRDDSAVIVRLDQNETGKFEPAGIVVARIKQPNLKPGAKPKTAFLMKNGEMFASSELLNLFNDSGMQKARSHRMIDAPSDLPIVAAPTVLPTYPERAYSNTPEVVPVPVPDEVMAVQPAVDPEIPVGASSQKQEDTVDAEMVEDKAISVDQEIAPDATDSEKHPEGHELAQVLLGDISEAMGDKTISEEERRQKVMAAYGRSIVGGLARPAQHREYGIIAPSQHTDASRVFHEGVKALIGQAQAQPKVEEAAGVPETLSSGRVFEMGPGPVRPEAIAVTPEASKEPRRFNKEYSIDGKGEDGSFSVFSELVHEVQQREEKFGIPLSGQLTKEQALTLADAATSVEQLDALASEYLHRGEQIRNDKQLFEKHQSGKVYEPEQAGKPIEQNRMLSTYIERRKAVLRAEARASKRKTAERYLGERREVAGPMGSEAAQDLLGQLRAVQYDAKLGSEQRDLEVQNVLDAAVKAGIVESAPAGETPWGVRAGDNSSEVTQIFMNGLDAAMQPVSSVEREKSASAEALRNQAQTEALQPAIPKSRNDAGSEVVKGQGMKVQMLESGDHDVRATANRNSAKIAQETAEPKAAEPEENLAPTPFSEFAKKANVKVDTSGKLNPRQVAALANVATSSAEVKVVLDEIKARGGKNPALQAYYGNLAKSEKAKATPKIPETVEAAPKIEAATQKPRAPREYSVRADKTDPHYELTTFSEVVRKAGIPLGLKDQLRPRQVAALARAASTSEEVESIIGELVARGNENDGRHVAFNARYNELAKAEEAATLGATPEIPAVEAAQASAEAPEAPTVEAPAAVTAEQESYSQLLADIKQAYDAGADEDQVAALAKRVEDGGYTVRNSQDKLEAVDTPEARELVARMVELYAPAEADEDTSSSADETPSAPPTSNSRPLVIPPFEEGGRSKRNGG